MNYDTPEKEHYRRIVWRELAEAYALEAGDLSEASAFIVDTSLGAETACALSCGIKEGKLHVCNHNPAHVAIIRRTYSLLFTHGVSAGRAFETMASAGQKVDLVNLDLCSNISAPLLRQLSAMGRSSAFGYSSNCEPGYAGGVLGLTLLAGRETAPITRLLRAVEHLAVAVLGGSEAIREKCKGLSLRDLARIAVALAATGLRPHPHSAWQYQSRSHQPIIFVVAQLDDYPILPRLPRKRKPSVTGDVLEKMHQAFYQRDLAILEVRKLIDPLLMSAGAKVRAVA
jgi:hypothetical protein